jgi:hypothetical protein
MPCQLIAQLSTSSRYAASVGDLGTSSRMGQAQVEDRGVRASVEEADAPS